MTAAQPARVLRPPPRPATPRRPDHASTNTGGSSTVMMAAYGSVGEYASVAAAVAVVTINAYSKRIMLAHSTNASTIAMVIEMIAQGLNISHAGVPGQRRDPAADPEPAGRIERRQTEVGHVVQGRGVGEAGQVLGAELLVDRDAEQIQLGRAQRHRQGDHRERGQEDQRAGAGPARGGRAARAGRARTALPGRRIGRPWSARAVGSTSCTPAIPPALSRPGRRPPRPPPRRPPPPSGRGTASAPRIRWGACGRWAAECVATPSSRT